MRLSCFGNGRRVDPERGETALLTLYDAPRCPFCARSRIVLAEKQIEYETVVVDLDTRPDWIVELNPPDGRVPVLEDSDRLILPESSVINRYLDERFPQPPLMPSDPFQRACVELAIDRFNDRLGGPHYRVYFGDEPASERLEPALRAFDRELEAHPYVVGSDYTLADIAYVPWILRTPARIGIDVRGYAGIRSWLERLESRPAIAAEIGVVASL